MGNGIVDFIKRALLLLILVVGVMAGVGGLVYLTGTLAIHQEIQVDATLAPTILATASTPVARFAQLDPAIISYLEHGQPRYGIIPLSALGPEVQPVGAFLPRTGNSLSGAADGATSETTIDQATLPVTAFPYVTSPPLLTPAGSPSPTTTPGPSETSAPTLTPTEPEDRGILPTGGVPATVIFGGDTPVFPAGMLVANAPTPAPGQNCAPSNLPVEGILTQSFSIYHSGIDIGVPQGTPVLATQSGQVTFAGWSPVGYGNLVIIQSADFITYYGHNTSFNVTAGQTVRKGSIISWSGSTGNSSGPHVHYETRIDDLPVDPLTFESRGYPSC